MEIGVLKIKFAQYQISRNTKDNDSNNIMSTPMTYNMTRALIDIIK